MKDDKSAQSVSYMLKYYLTKSITDPLSQTSRGYSDYSQYFTGTNTAGQVNYLERKPTTAGRFVVSVSGVTKTSGVDYLLDRTNMTITWAAFTPPATTDNILAEYQAVKRWVYDDHPYLEGDMFPRLTVDILNEDQSAPGLGVYHNYATGMGNYVELLVKVIVRNRKSNEYYTYGSVHYKNFDLINAISQSITDFFNSNREVILWKFWDWQVIRSERIKTEEDSGVFRKDITLKVRYFEKS